MMRFVHLLMVFSMSLTGGQFLFAKEKKAKSEKVAEPAAKEPQATPRPTRVPEQSSVGKMTNHRDAYKDRKTDVEHLNIKITPAEKRGKPGFVEVELYNNSDYNLAIVKFDLTFESDSYFTYTDSIEFQDMDQNYSAKQDRRISDGKMPLVTKVTVGKIEIYAKDAGGIKPIRLPVFTEIVKS